MINGTTTGGPCQYDYQPTNNVNNYYSPYTPNAQSPISMKIQNGKNNTTIAGNIQSIKSKMGGFKKITGKVTPLLKKIRPGHVMTLMMFGLVAFSRCGVGVANSSAKQSQTAAVIYEKGYEQGKQKAVDSMKVAYLERELKVARDSINMLKKVHK